MTPADSEAHSEPGAVPPGEPPPAPAGEPQPVARAPAMPPVIPALAAALIVLLLLVLLSPLWAPPLGELLPWGEKAAVSRDEHAALARQVAGLEERLATTAAVKADEAALAQRLDRLEAAQRQDADAAAAQRQKLETRFAALEQRPAGNPETEAALGKAQQELARLATSAGDLATRLAALENRLAAVEKEGRDRANAPPSPAPLLVALLQIREAVDAARPFPAEYAALMSLAKDRPDIGAAAAPLQPAAQDGVASRAMLRQRLDDLDRRLGETGGQPPPRDWQGQALARLRGLVTIRRIDGPGQSAAENAVADARRRLAGGDLDSAVRALEGLRDADAAAAGPWLRLAKQRLAVETALSRLQSLLSAELGKTPPAASPAAAPPAKAPS